MMSSAGIAAAVALIALALSSVAMVGSWTAGHTIADSGTSAQQALPSDASVLLRRDERNGLASTSAVSETVSTIVSTLTNRKQLLKLTPATARTDLAGSIGEFAEAGRSEMQVELEVRQPAPMVKSARMAFLQGASSDGKSDPGRFDLDWIEVALGDDVDLLEAAKRELTKRLGKPRFVLPSKSKPTTWIWRLKNDWHVSVDRASGEEVKAGVAVKIRSTVHTEDED